MLTHSFTLICDTVSYGHVAKSILPYMMSFHIEHRPIWLVRAGHCNEVRRDFGAITKDPCIAPRAARLSHIGMDFAFRLGEFVKQRTNTWMENEGITPDDNPTEALVITSTLPRAVETAAFINGRRRELLRVSLCGRSQRERGDSRTCL